MTTADARTPQSALRELTRQLAGRRVPGGCEYCNAFQAMHEDELGIFHLTVHHDDWCPFLARDPKLMTRCAVEPCDSCLIARLIEALGQRKAAELLKAIRSNTDTKQTPTEQALPQGDGFGYPSPLESW
jgi:hypothetical protein